MTGYRNARLCVVALVLLAVAAGATACSKCDMGGLFKGCGGSAPKS